MQTPTNCCEISSKIAAKVIERATYVIESFGPRPPGSVAEKQALDFAQTLIEPLGKVQRESFQFAPMAFFCMQRVSATLGMMALVSYWLHPLAGLGFGLLSLLIKYQQLLRYRLFLDPFFPKAKSENLWAILEPTGEVKQTIIINAHPDAAFEWRWNRMFPKLFAPLVAIMLISLFLVPLLCLAGWFTTSVENGRLFSGIGLSLLFPSFVLAFFFNDLKVVAPGANDNLSGMFLGLGIFEHFALAKLKQTKLIFLLTGSEEAGLRGAKGWATRHRVEFAHKSTSVITLDTIRDLDYLKIYSRDLNGTVRHDPEVCQWLKETGAKTGIIIPEGTVFLGATDAAALTQAGFRCATIAAMDPAPAFYYHTRWDTPQNMNPKCIEVVATLLINAISNLD